MTASFNGFTGKLISSYLRRHCPDASPLVCALPLHGRDYAADWMVTVPDLTKPGGFIHGKYCPHKKILIKDFCDGVLQSAGYKLERMRHNA